MADKIWVREVAEVDGLDTEELLPLTSAIQRLRDETTILTMQRHRGNSRELAMVLTKLDEARLWAVAYGEAFGSHMIVPRADILRDALADV